MPRGPVIFTLPPGTTPQNSGDPIPSAMFNAFADDVANTFNTAQPIEYGGTNAATPVGAIDNFSTLGTPIPSAATTDIWSATGNFVHIANSVTITSLGLTSTAGNERTVVFDGAPLLTHNVTSLILPGSVNIQAAAGDTMVVRSEGGANSRVISYQRANGQPIANAREFITSTSIISGGGQSSLAYPNLSAYRRIYLTGYCSPSTDNVGLILRTSTNNGSSYDSGASDYDYQTLRGNVATVSTVATPAFSSIGIGGTTSLGNAANEGISFEICLDNFNAGFYMFARADSYGNMEDGTFIKSQVGGRRLSATPRNAVQIAFSAGNVLRCFVTVEGIRG